MLFEVFGSTLPYRADHHLPRFYSLTSSEEKVEGLGHVVYKLNSLLRSKMLPACADVVQLFLDGKLQNGRDRHQFFFDVVNELLAVQTITCPLFNR